MGREMCSFRITCKAWLEVADAEVRVFGVKGIETKSVAVLKRLPALRDLTMRSMQWEGASVADVLSRLLRPQILTCSD